MPFDAIICDWNGTLILYRDERPLLETVAVQIFKSSVPFHPFRMLRILQTRKKLETLYSEARLDADFDFVRAMFSVYNEKIIKGTSVSVIRHSIENYASHSGTQRALDFRILRTIQTFHQEGTVSGILSAGYGYGIERVLTVAGFYRYFDFCKADYLKEANGRAVGFSLDIYKRKHEVLAELLNERKLDASRVVYIGDSEDDEGCFQIVGHPVLAFLAPDWLKGKYAREYSAFVPHDEEDLVNHLRCI